MIDVSVSYNKYKFLGYEFLTWMWFVIDNDHDLLRTCGEPSDLLEIGNRVVLEKKHDNDKIESITIKGDDAGLEEGMLSLKKGAVVTELNLVYKSSGGKWQFTIKGESLHIAGLKTPKSGMVESGEEVEGAVLEKMGFIDKVINFTDNLFKIFIKLRVSNEWNNTTVFSMRKWIKSDI
jgi:hypothetical protein